MLNAYNEIGETLYYANPKTWVRTLVTGEGFAWLTHKRGKRKRYVRWY